MKSIVFILLMFFINFIYGQNYNIVGIGGTYSGGHVYEATGSLEITDSIYSMRGELNGAPYTFTIDILKKTPTAIYTTDGVVTYRVIITPSAGELRMTNLKMKRNKHKTSWTHMMMDEEIGNPNNTQTDIIYYLRVVE